MTAKGEMATELTQEIGRPANTAYMYERNVVPLNI